MENNKEHHIERTNFDAFVHAVGSEIEQAQVRLITAANAQMLFHYWKIGNYILYHQNLQGWGSKIIKQLAKAIRLNYPEKKGYSERNLTYMCQFARSYPLNVLRSFIDTDARLSVPSIQKVADEVLKLNNGQFTQELTAQIQSTDSQLLEFTQEPLAQIQNVAKTVSAIYRITIATMQPHHDGAFLPVFQSRSPDIHSQTVLIGITVIPVEGKRLLVAVPSHTLALRTT